MSDYKCLLAGGPDSENSHDLLPKLMEPQTGLMSPFRHRPHFQGGWGWEKFRARHRTQSRVARGGFWWPDVPGRIPNRHLLPAGEPSRWHSLSLPPSSQNRRPSLTQKQQDVELLVKQAPGECSPSLPMPFSFFLSNSPHPLQEAALLSPPATGLPGPPSR